MNVLKLVHRYYLGSVLFALLILLGSLYGGYPNSQFKFPIPYMDKWIHAISYLLLTLIFLREISFHNKNSGPVVFFFAFLLLFSYGCLMELLQLWFTDYRTASITDALINGAGIIAALVVRWAIK